MPRAAGPAMARGCSASARTCRVRAASAPCRAQSCTALDRAQRTGRSLEPWGKRRFGVQTTAADPATHPGNTRSDRRHAQDVPRAARQRTAEPCTSLAAWRCRPQGAAALLGSGHRAPRAGGVMNAVRRCLLVDPPDFRLGSFSCSTHSSAVRPVVAILTRPGCAASSTTKRGPPFEDRSRDQPVIAWVRQIDCARRRLAVPSSAVGHSLTKSPRRPRCSTPCC